MFGLRQSRYFGQAPNPALFAPLQGADTRLRGLEAADAPEYVRHLLRLSPEDRHARFHSMPSDEVLRDHARRMDWDRVFIFGLFIRGVLRATGELIPLADPERGELSLSVEHDFQHKGAGKMLTLSVFLAARRLGMTRLHIFYRRGNDAMQALARDIGARIRFIDGTMEAVVNLPRAPADKGRM